MEGWQPCRDSQGELRQKMPMTCKWHGHIRTSPVLRSIHLSVWSLENKLMTPSVAIAGSLGHKPMKCREKMMRLRASLSMPTVPTVSTVPTVPTVWPRVCEICAEAFGTMVSRMFTHLSYRNFALFGYGSIPINTIFRGMNIHLPAILMFTRCQGFDPSPFCNQETVSMRQRRTTWTVKGSAALRKGPGRI